MADIPTDPLELAAKLRGMSLAYPEDVFPTPPVRDRCTDAAAAHVLRRIAVPWFAAAADTIDRLAGELEQARSVIALHQQNGCGRQLYAEASLRHAREWLDSSDPGQPPNREDVQAALRGIREGVWEPTDATKRWVGDALEALLLAGSRP